MIFSTLAKCIPKIVDFVNEVTFSVGNMMFTDLAQVTRRNSTKMCNIAQAVALIDFTNKVLGLVTAINTNAMDPIFIWFDENKCDFGC